MTAVTGPLLRSRQSRHFVIVIAAQGKVQGIFVTLGDGGFRNYGLGLLRPRRRAPALLSLIGGSAQQPSDDGMQWLCPRRTEPAPTVASVG